MISSTQAYAEGSAPSGSSQSSQDSQTPSTAGDSPDRAPTFDNAGRNRLVADYWANNISAHDFISIGLDDVLGGTPPPQYQDAAVNGSAGTPSQSSAQATSPEAGPATSTTNSDGSTPDAADDPLADASSAGVKGTSADFLDYIFAVAATESQADQAQFVEAFDATVADAAPASTTLGASSAPTKDCGSHITFPKAPGLPKINFPITCETSSQHFRVFYTLQSQSAKDGVTDGDTSGAVDNLGREVPNGISDYIDNVVASSEDADGYYAGLGYKHPPGKVNIFIGRFGGLFDDGEAITPPPVAGQQFIFMANRSTEIYIPHHEVFHTFQYPYIASSKLVRGFASMNWWMEATAEWAAHQSMAHTSMASLVPTTGGASEENQYAHDLGAYLGQPTKQLDAWAGLGGARQYGAFIFAEYLADRFGSNAILRTWQKVGADNGIGIAGGTWPVTAIKQMLKEQGSSYAIELPMYAKAVYQLGPDAGTSTTVCVLDYSGTNPLDGTGGCGANQYPQTVQTGGGYSSNQFQFTDPDLSDWINTWLAADSRTTPKANDPAPSNPRPKHTVALLNATGKAHGSVRLGDGGMSFTDLTWTGAPNQSPSVTVKADFNGVPVKPNLHVSLISWTSYRTRCAPDQDADITKIQGKVTLTAPANILTDRCAFSTLVITQTSPANSQGTIPEQASWSTKFVTPNQPA